MVAVGVPELFNLIERSVELYGPYDDVKRAISHHLIGATLMPTTYRLGTTFTDSRVNLMVVLPTGHGKREVSTAVDHYAKLMWREGEFSKPSTHHPQQLVGTMVKHVNPEGEEVWAPVRGFLDKRFLVFEEAFRILSHVEEAETRQLLSQALDPYTRNEISKKNLAWDKELRYHPRCSVAMLWQPQPVPIDVWRGGLTRRFLWIVLDELTNEQAVDILRQAIDNQPRDLVDEVSRLAGRIAIRMDQAARSQEPFILSFGAVSSLIKEGAKQAFDIAQDHSAKCRGLPHTLKFTFLHLLMKMSANHAAAHAADIAYHGSQLMIPAQVNVAADDVMAAADDLSAFVKRMVVFLDQHIQLPVVTSPLGQAIQAMLRNHGPTSEQNLINNLQVSGQMGRYSDEDVRRELQVMCLLGVAKFTEDEMYEVVDPIV